MVHGHIGREVVAGLASQLSESAKPKLVVRGPRTLATVDQRGTITSVDGISYPLSAINRMTSTESVMTLEDLMFRRTEFGWNERLGMDTVNEVAEAVRETAGWSVADVGVQIAAYRTTLERAYKFRG
jgi:glycerol-3-phosphate dehydrogenase